MSEFDIDEFDELVDELDEFGDEDVDDEDFD